jgi:hypothetical protein
MIKIEESAMVTIGNQPKNSQFIDENHPSSEINIVDQILLLHQKPQG